MTKQQTKFKKAVAIAKQLRKKNPALKYTDAIKKAFKSLGSTTHKDTKSHNVNIRVVSGVKRKKKISGVQYCIKNNAGEYFTISMSNGMPKFTSNANFAYTYEKDEATKVLKQLKNQGYNNIDIYPYMKKSIISGRKKVGATLLLEKGETARTKPKSIKTITRTKAGTFKKWKTLGAAPGFADPMAADEIRLYADNNSQLYYSRRLPILKNLYKKWKKGTFKIELAAKLWKYYIEDAMQRYTKEHGSRGEKWHKLLSVSDRKLLATDYAKQTLYDFENHMYSDADMK